jgi:hypothetical protein
LHLSHLYSSDYALASQHYHLFQVYFSCYSTAFVPTHPALPQRLDHQLLFKAFDGFLAALHTPFSGE